MKESWFFTRVYMCVFVEVCVKVCNGVKMC